MSTPISAPSEMAFFSLLARTGSFSATALDLGISKPAVSKRLALLEARLGVQLPVLASKLKNAISEGADIGVDIIQSK